MTPPPPLDRRRTLTPPAVARLAVAWLAVALHAGAQPAGVQAAGVQASGVQAAGVQAAGVQATGVQRGAAHGADSVTGAQPDLAPPSGHTATSTTAATTPPALAQGGANTAAPGGVSDGRPAAPAAHPAPLPPPGPPYAPPRLDALAPGVWLVRGAAGESDAANRAATSNLLVVAQGDRTWALGSGPSPDYGRALAAAVQAQTGRALTDLVAAWAHPEAVLGASGLPQLRFWAHEEVAQAMQARCGSCIERLALRLGSAAGDLADLPAQPGQGAASAPPDGTLGPRRARVPEQRLQGESGSLGPWRWWRLQRAREPAEEARARRPGEAPRNPTLVSTLWWLPQAGLWAAPGLLWSDGPPDLRDSEVSSLLPATRQAREIAREAITASARAQGPAAAPPRWLPEQGEPQDGSLLDRHERYWLALQAAAARAWEDGTPETDPPPPLNDASLPPAWGAHLRHGLNWQRAWREAEAGALARP